MPFFYEEVPKNPLDNTASLVELWVIGGGGAHAQGGAGGLERMYYRATSWSGSEWQRFLDSVRVDGDQVRPLALLRTSRAANRRLSRASFG